ncbi:unnamed protein product [marine sediment metagenome]|uniref:Uncharacterized protein n=1 Tax=marine sediment metagenome TaxID=412755 RepID=X1UDG1_9ZZZZ
MKQEKKQKRVQRESLSYTVEVRDKEGRVIQRISAPSRSYVEQWNQLLNVHASQANKTIRDTQGNEYSITTHAYNLCCNAAIGVITYGIRIGKGTTAVAIDDYALESPVGEGVGLDEFNHQAMVFTEPSVAGSTCSFKLRRTMINNSGATITGIRELGCYVRLAATYYGLGFRDVLGSGCDVPDGGAITVEYTLGVTA